MYLRMHYKRQDGANFFSTVGSIGCANAIRYLAECRALPTIAAYTLYLKSRAEKEIADREEKLKWQQYELQRDNYFAEQLWVLGAGLNFASGTGKSQKPTYERFAEMLKRMYEGEAGPPPKITKEDVKAQFLRLKRKRAEND